MGTTTNSWIPSTKVWRERQLLQYREEGLHWSQGRCERLTLQVRRIPEVVARPTQRWVLLLYLTSRFEDQSRWDAKKGLTIKTEPRSSYAFPLSPCQKCCPYFQVNKSLTNCVTSLDKRHPQNGHLWGDGHHTQERTEGICGSCAQRQSSQVRRNILDTYSSLFFSYYAE